MISSYYLSLISLFNVNNYYTNKETIKSTKEFSNYEYKIKYENFFKKINKSFLIVPNLLNYKTEYMRVICFNFWSEFNLESTCLALSNTGIEEIPKEIQFLTNLQSLYLYNNKLKEVPTEINFLTNLKELDLENNQIKIIPTEIKFLTNLASLCLENNKITVIPKELEHMKDKIVLW